MRLIDATVLFHLWQKLAKAVGASLHCNRRARTRAATRSDIEVLETRVVLAASGLEIGPAVAAEGNLAGGSDLFTGPYDGIYRATETLALTTVTYSGNQTITTPSTLTTVYTFEIHGTAIYYQAEGMPEPNYGGALLGGRIGLSLFGPRLSTFSFESHSFEGTISSSHAGYTLSGTSTFLGKDHVTGPGHDHEDYVIGAGSWVAVMEEGVRNVAISNARFTGPQEIPSANLTFDWAYSNTGNPSASERFTATLYYSSDPIFDDADVKVGKTLNVTVRSGTESGSASFIFGTRKPLQPNKTLPYVLVVLDDQKPDDNSSDNTASVVLPYLNITSINAEENQSGNKLAGLSTLMHSSTFNLDASPFFDDSEFEIEFRRIGSLQPGQTDDWMPFVAGEAQSVAGVPTLSGKHRLAGDFEFRVAAELNGVRFTSEHYSGNKKSASLPQIEVRYPTVDEILQSDLFVEPLVQDGARQLWGDTLRQFTTTYDPVTHTATIREYGSWVVLDTRDGQFHMFEVVEGKLRPATDQGQTKDGDEIASINTGSPPPDEERADGTGRYLVAHFHTHTPITGISQHSGLLFSRRAGESDQDLKWLKSFRGIIIPGLVYDFEGIPIFGDRNWVNDDLYPNLPDEVFTKKTKIYAFNTGDSDRRVGHLHK